MPSYSFIQPLMSKVLPFENKKNNNKTILCNKLGTSSTKLGLLTHYTNVTQRSAMYLLRKRSNFFYRTDIDSIFKIFAERFGSEKQKGLTFYQTLCWSLLDLCILGPRNNAIESGYWSFCFVIRYVCIIGPRSNAFGEVNKSSVWGVIRHVYLRSP